MIKYIKNEINRKVFFFPVNLLGYPSHSVVLPLKTSILSSINVTHAARLFPVLRVTITYGCFLSSLCDN